MKSNAFLILLILCFTSSAIAQKEANNWFFGCTNIGVTFNSGKPVLLTKKGYDTRYGCATMSNSAGRLLFYVTTSRIIDSTHNLMTNGSLNSNYLTIQPNLIVPWPDSSHLFYIFSSDPFSYSIINMKLRGGLGDVVNTEKEKSLPTVSSGKVTAVIHENKRNYWLVIPQGNSDTIAAYLITSKGIASTPVKSATGVYSKATPLHFNEYYSGYFKLSPDGKKLCNINRGKPSMVADFDATTGKVSNVWQFTNYASGIEFSPKGKYLYVCTNDSTLSQYNLESKSQTEFLASRKTIDSTKNYEYRISSLQLASDGKIYIYQSLDNKFLNVIHDPDSAGNHARVEKNFFKYQNYIESVTHWSLPNFVQSIFYKPSFRVKQNCANDSAFFTIKETYELDSVHWDFGDTASGASNFSTQTTNVFHHYKKQGNYKVRLISFHKGYTDTLYETFLLKPLKPYIGKDTNFCKSKYLFLSPNDDYPWYKWSTSQTSKGIYVTNPGTYYLTVTDYQGCKGADTIIISKPLVKADFNANSFSQCEQGNNFKLKETTTYNNGIRYKSSWYYLDNILGYDTITSLSFDHSGTYSIKLVSESYGGCMDSITKQITVNPNASAAFEINYSVQCFNEHRFDFDIKEDTGKVSFVWDLGDKSITIGNDITDKKYLDDGTYSIRLIATTDKNCSDTVVKSVTVLPSPKADFSWGVACSRTPTKFEYTGSKPVQSFLWNFNNEATSTLENPTHKFASSGTSITTLTLTAPNGCTDALTKTIEIKTQSTADFITTDVCETDIAVFTNKSEDATSYNWRFGDGLKSTNESPKHLYNIGGVSKTFNVSLVAIVNNGCSDSITKAISINANPKSDFSYTKSGKSFNFTSSQSGNSKYRWLFGDGDSAITGTASHTYTDAINEHTVCLKATNAAGCISETCKILSTVGVSLINPSGFKIYPNPNTGSFTIEMDNPTREALIEVYDVMGKMVKTIERVEKITRVDLEAKPGIYLVKVRNGANVWFQKIFVSTDEDSKR